MALPSYTARSVVIHHFCCIKQVRFHVRVRSKSLTNADHPESSGLNHAAYKRGCTLFNDGHFNKAKLAFEEALSYWPEDSHGWMALGNCHDDLNKPKAAEECYRKALAYCDDKDRSSIVYNLANSLLDQGQYDKAIALYEQILGQSAVYTKAQRNLSRAKRLLNGGRK